jgi:hypothetical protein
VKGNSGISMLVDILSREDLFTHNNKQGGIALIAKGLDIFSVSDSLYVNNNKLVSYIIKGTPSDDSPMYSSNK